MKSSGMILGIIVLFSFAAEAQTATLDEVWSKIRANSPVQGAAQLQLQSTSEGLDRSERHWLPKVYLDARSYQTNDPGNSFFGILEQRKVEQTDFVPNSLNHPEASTYTRGALGVDLALYEGGMKSNQALMYKHTYNAQKAFSEQVEVEQYSQVSVSYGVIAALLEQVSKLQFVDSELQRLIKSYQIGQKSNPVGYSGLLGMKSLSYRISGLISQFEAQKSAYLQALQVMGWDNQSWIPVKFDTESFVNKYLPIATQKQDSAKIRSNLENSKASQEMANMEKARFLPRVGAFAESYLFKGNRDQATGYTAGLYLQWNLFDAGDYGRHKEAVLKSMAAQKQTEALGQQESAEFAAAVQADQALRSNLKLLNESDLLLKEQMQVATTLFKNGSISALQLVEIINRRVDLISQQSELKLELIKNSGSAVTKSDFKIPVATTAGGVP